MNSEIHVTASVYLLPYISCILNNYSINCRSGIGTNGKIPRFCPVLSELQGVFLMKKQKMMVWAVYTTIRQMWTAGILRMKKNAIAKISVAVTMIRGFTFHVIPCPATKDARFS